MDITSKSALLVTLISSLFLSSPNTQTKTETKPLEFLVETKAKEAGVNPELIKALIDVESSWNPNAIKFEPNIFKKTGNRMLSSSHGLMQILGLNATPRVCPGINSWFTLYNPEQNLSCGIHILKTNILKTGSIYSALVAYNGGLGCTSKLCPSAIQYANKVMNQYKKRLG